MGAQTESVRGEPGSSLYLNSDGVGVNGNPLPSPIKVGRHRASSLEEEESRSVASDRQQPAKQTTKNRETATAEN